MKKQRRKHSAEFKARVAFEAIQGLKTQSEIAKQFEIHPIMVGKWKNELLERMPELFEGKRKQGQGGTDKERQQLERKVGQLTMEVDFLEKKCEQLGIPVKKPNS
ncbi:transposase [Desulfogranum marinum]|uniref:transposase n=1 Tax=Desulfogranum marinum TaxID=453220 RepID=UPI0029C93694|nr:transposase [Desulfogranum marinum]